MIVSKCGDVFYFNPDLKHGSEYYIYANKYMLDKELEKNQSQTKNNIS